MNISERIQGGIISLRLWGEDDLDYSCSADLREDLLSRIDGTADVVIDMSAIEFIDSGGLSVLVGLFKKVRSAGRQVRFAGAKPAVLHVIETIRLDEIFQLSPDVPTAIESLTA